LAPGREIEPLSPEWRRAYDASGVRLRHLADHRRARPLFLGPASATLEALRADPPDVVVADDWRGLAYLALRSRQLGMAFADTAFVVYCHGPARVLAESAQKVPDTLARFGEQVAERASLELADAVVSPSEWLLGWMRDHGWPVPASARVVQNLWQSTALGETSTPAAAGSRIGRLAFFGQLREGKGILIFVEALRALESDLLNGIDLLFLGRETPRWTADRIHDALGAGVADRVASIRFETGLERSAALAELKLPGTLAVMPSLLDNSPYAVAECIEHGIPFVSTSTGGIPELVAREDGRQVLCRPTPDDLAATLRRALGEGTRPARPARAPEQSLASWLELIETVTPVPARATTGPAQVAVVASGDESLRRARRLAEHTRSVAVDVVSAPSRSAGLEAASAEWVLFLDDEDAPDDAMLDALVAAQAASNADVVTAAVRPADDPEEIQLFLGDPDALGLVENQYGVLGLVRRSLTAAHSALDGAVDPDWILFARLALGGARVVSIPDPLSVHTGRPGTIADVPGDGLAILETFEGDQAARLHYLPQMAATLAAALARTESRQAVAKATTPGILERGLGILRSEGVTELVRRARARMGGH
jgi:glycosyltransferase involved in cell wall biosynthesis